jgi:hypothetical protein
MARTKYKIIRHFMHRDNKVIMRGLTLAQAKRHCSDPESSSSTCASPVNVSRTHQYGPWFDGFDKE